MIDYIHNLLRYLLITQVTNITSEDQVRFQTPNLLVR
jgi:hypothetical protein